MVNKGIIRIMAVITIMFAASNFSAHAQLGNALKKAKEKAKEVVKDAANTGDNSTITERISEKTDEAAGAASLTPSQREAHEKVMDPGKRETTILTEAKPSVSPQQSGAVFYVSETTGGGSRTADGSKEKPFKDLQAAIDKAGSGAIIKIAEGVYHGKMDQGFIEITQYMTLEGGWNTGFTERDFVKYPTRIQPGLAQGGTSGAHALMDIYIKGDPNAPITIDGIMFDMGFFNTYAKAPSTDPVASAPEGCETGRIICVGDAPSVPKTEGVTVTRQCMRGTVEGKLTIRNCSFVNAYHYGIQMENFGGHWDICNNLFVACRMAGCEVRGVHAKHGVSTLDFHHNTVLFSWTRTKLLEDMGYGFRYMTRINCNVHDNIFGCNYYGALDRGRVDSDLKHDEGRETSACNNLFFENTMGDICLPSGGAVWQWMKAKDFEEVEQLKRFEGNREINEQEAQALNQVINQPYMKGFLGLSMSQSSSFNPSSAANLFRSAHGMNMQGTETVRVTMYGNRYPIAEVGQLFGAIAGKGAQR